MDYKEVNAVCQPGDDVASRDWYAWNNKMPPGPARLIVTGIVTVGNPGVEPMLVIANPQGINPSHLLLNIFLCQKPGKWPSVVVDKPVRFEQHSNPMYTHVDIVGGPSIEIFDAH
ncbi:hypothetical protein [Ruegeria faecimaris]|uniref:Uncharacterized protein n=1 Tax=Ruegeria faecimaris TaxID=686389 RepID=A0A521BLT0_9RHOB|nr:hypothetical protein [Ruegeria faecimaris]SMO48107.1 hypothetical protein SAMN06265380_101951 [Ruegeria faecimaris]